MTAQDLTIGQQYLWTYNGQSVPIYYMGMFKGWHQFSGVEKRDTVSYEITPDEMWLIGEAEVAA